MNMDRKHLYFLYLFIRGVYRIIILLSGRSIINRYRNNLNNYRAYRNEYCFKLKQRIVKFLKKDLRRNPDKEKQEILKFLKGNPFYMVPYNFIKNYNQDDIVVHFDNARGMKFVFYDEKRLYFPSEWNPVKIQKYYNAILIEQDVVYCYGN
jgi:hypothetical protein